MKKLYILLAILLTLFCQTKAQNTATCTANFEYRDSISYSPFAHFIKFSAVPSGSPSKIVKKVCWNFGDGTDNCIESVTGTTTASLLTTTHTYPPSTATLTTYNVCVTIYYDGGCEAQSCRSITLQSPGTNPETCGADFRTETRPSSTLTNGLSNYFTAIPSNSNNKKPVYICWTFGDGTNQVCQQYAGTYTGTYATSHTFATAGQYQVCVDIHYDGGCESKTCHTITIPPPVVTPDSCSADFSVLNTPTISYLSKYFTAIPKHNHNKKPLLITWIFGDGSTQNLTYAGTYTGTYSVNHTYTAPGQYEVCVAIQYDGGCSSRQCHTITIPPIVTPDSCSAGFTVTASTVSGSGLGRAFTALPKHNHDKKPLSITWDFGDGSNQLSVSYASTYTGTYAVSHNYANAGTYQVCVVIHFDGGCESRKCDNVTIPPIVTPDSCSAGFNIISNTPNYSSLGKYFVALPKHNHDKKPVLICWTFGDGSAQVCKQYAGTYTGTYAVEHAYANYGHYEVCVVIHYDGGCESKNCQTITIPPIVTPDSCSAGFTVVSSPAGVNYLGKYFVATPKHNHDKKPVQICWTFGDGSAQVCQQYAGTFTGTYATLHNYTTPGQYEVCVDIHYDGGCESRKCDNITIPPVVTPDSCSAGFSVESAAGNSLNKYFVALPKHNHNKKPLSICWTFGDGSTQVCQQYAGTYTGTYATSHTYANAGQYQVCVVVHYDGGCESRKCDNITIPPVVTPDSCGAELNIISAASNSFLKYFTVTPKHNHNKKPLSVCWTFGDGSAQVCQQYADTFTGTYATSHTYANAGQYQVCVVVHYDGGCESRKCENITIPPVVTPDSCSAGFNVVSSTNINSLGKYFVALPKHNHDKKPVQICWTFGDGSAQVCQQYAGTFTGTYATFHDYTAPGQYQVCVIIHYDGGCESHKCDNINVAPIVTPDSCGVNFTVLSAATTSLGRNFTAVLKHNHNKKPLQICWSFGDGSAQVCQTYSGTYSGTYTIDHAYANYGQYQVCVSIKYDGGCESKNCETINIDRPSNVCEASVYEVATNITNLERKFYAGLMNGRAAEKICWSFGDGNADTCVIVTNPVTQESLITTHRYAAPGVYHVCIKVYYVGGCVVEKCIEVSIRPETVNTCGGYLTNVVTSARTVLFKGFGIQGTTDNVVSYTWTFGDGSTGSGQEVTHTYASGGTYPVCLHIKTTSGCETTICTHVSFDGNTQPQLVLTPNPVVSILHATFLSTRAETVSVRIFNANGLVIRSYTKTVAAGANNWDFTDVATLPLGVYSVVVTSSTQFATGIFFKQ